MSKSLVQQENVAIMMQ